MAKNLEAINTFAEKYKNVKQYMLISPTAVNILGSNLPMAAPAQNQQEYIDNYAQKLDSNIKFVDTYTTLLEHKKEDAEIKLNAGFKEIKAQVEGFLANKEYNKALDAFASIKPLVDNLFDNVMIMDKDEAVKENRLGLLKQIYDTMLTICDLSKIVYK